jgi:hypothetical protein
VSESQSATLRYLTPPEDAFWRWSADGKTVEWSDGTTIAFAPELIAVIERLAPHGLPPFDLVLLVLAACRDSWRDEAVVHSPFSGARTTRLGVLTEVLGLHVRDGGMQWIQNAIAALDLVHQLSAELRNDLDAKAELAALIFEYHPIRPMSSPAERVCRELRFGVPVAVLTQFDRPIKTVGQWIRELRGLYDGLHCVDEETLRLRLKTGLDRIVQPSPPEPEEPEEPPTPTIRELLDSLEQEDQFRGLVRLTRNLMAVVHLPKPVADRDELSLGGVSDITNRGPLDRLLLSELAHDTDTLTIRVALNEALYLRRERPPSNPPRQRVLLLDSGIRMWGVPRVYAAAVALSMAATAGNRAEICAFRATGGGVVPVDLATRDGLIAHLAALEPEAHPGKSLEAFRDELEESDSDVVLVTGEDVLADPEFRRALGESGLTPMYLAVLGRDGRFQLVARTERGQKVVREAVLQLDELLESKPDRPAPKIIDAKIDPRLPAILKLKQFPLRLSHSIDPKQVFASPTTWDEDQFIVTVTHDRRLMVWTDPKVGGMQATDRLPPGRLHHWWCNRKDLLVYCIIGRGNLSQLHVVRLSMKTGEYNSVPLATDRSGALAVCSHAGGLFVIHRDCVEVFDPDTGERRYDLRLRSDARWMRDRFFRTADGWYGLSFDGISARLDRIATGDLDAIQAVAGVFDSVVCNGPVVVLASGIMLMPAQQPPLKIPHGLRTPVKLIAVSHDGDRFVVSPLPPPAVGDGQGSCFIRLWPRVEARPVHVNPWTLVEPEIRGLAQRSLRVRIQAISASKFHLAVLTPRRGWLRFEWSSAARHFVFRPNADTDDLGPLCRSFQPMPGPPGVGYTLRRAEWADGSRAILDSRGLLHLQSSDAAVPECTLVLCDHDVAGWCADGRIWGSEYFNGLRVRPTDAEEILKSVILPFVSRLE